MIQLLIRMCLIVLVINQLATPCSAWGYGRSNKVYKEPVQSNANAGKLDIPPLVTQKSPAISAWGIVILVVAIILVITGLYYFSICYPAICHKNTKYNLMGAPTLA